MNKQQQALQYRQNGYNCAQAILCTYASECGLSEEAAYKLSSGLFGGVAARRELCGAVNAMAMVIGLKKSKGIQGRNQDKAEISTSVNRAIDSINQEFGSTNCGELIGHQEPLCLTLVGRCVECIERENGNE